MTTVQTAKAVKAVTTTVVRAGFYNAQGLMSRATRFGRGNTSASLLSALNGDIATFNGIPAQNCAGIFRSTADMAKAIKGLSKKAVEGLTITANSESKKVVINGQPKLTTAINTLIDEIPEFFDLMAGKHNEPGLAQHSLGTLRALVNQPKFERLNPIEKLVLTVVAPLHDIGKLHSVDETHAEKSVQILTERFKQINMPSSLSAIILKLTEHHDYSYNIKHGIRSHKYYARTLTDKVFNLLEMLTIADIASKPFFSLKNMIRKDENSRIFSFQHRLYRRLNASQKAQEAGKKKTL